MNSLRLGYLILAFLFVNQSSEHFIFISVSNWKQTACGLTQLQIQPKVVQELKKEWHFLVNWIISFERFNGWRFTWAFSRGRASRSSSHWASRSCTKQVGSHQNSVTAQQGRKRFSIFANWAHHIWKNNEFSPAKTVMLFSCARQCWKMWHDWES